MATKTLPLILVGGAVLAGVALATKSSEASEGGDDWETDSPDRDGGGSSVPVGGIRWRRLTPVALDASAIGAIQGYSVAGTPAGATPEQDARRNAYIAQLTDRAITLGLTLEDVNNVVEQILGANPRFRSNAMYRVIFSMENLDLLLPTLSGVNPPLPSLTEAIPYPADGRETRELQEALNSLEGMLVEAGLAQEALWYGAEAFGRLDGIELSSQFGSSIFTQYVNRIQQLGAIELRGINVTHPFLSVQGGKVCGVRGRLLEEARIPWAAESGKVRLTRSAPVAPVAVLGWGDDLHTVPNAPYPGDEGVMWGTSAQYTRIVAQRSWPLVEDGVFGACTEYAQTVIYAAASAVGLADLAAGISGVNPTTGSPNPSLYSPAQAALAVERSSTQASHLALGWRSLKQRGLIQWELREPGP